MKVILQPILAITALFFGLCSASGVTFITLHDFGTGDDGTGPQGYLVLSDGTLYGTTSGGGSGNSGTVFRVNIDGTAFTNLHSFTGTDGMDPNPVLGLSSNVLYGTTVYGGGFGLYGTIFKLNTDGGTFSNLFVITNAANGWEPRTGVLVSDSVIYGTLFSGGAHNCGIAFKIMTDGSSFTDIHDFDGTNGQFPGGFVLSGDTLYGSTELGGYQSQGTSGILFKLDTSGNNFTNLHGFTQRIADAGRMTNADGSGPLPIMALEGDVLYGMTSDAGVNGGGTIFRINADGTCFTNLYSFGDNFGESPQRSQPSGLIVSGNVLYGTLSATADSGRGAIFKINTDGTGYTNIYNFSPLGESSGNLTNYDGANPTGNLVLTGHTLYGSASYGGYGGAGTVFALNLLNPIPLNIQTVGANVVLTWADPAFTLQSALTPIGLFTNVNKAASPYTNTVAGTQLYYRLIAN